MNILSIILPVIFMKNLKQINMFIKTEKIKIINNHITETEKN